MKQSIGFILIVVGILVASGSANDCDGRCIEQANDMGTMLMVASAGILATLVGALAVFSARN